MQGISYEEALGNFWVLDADGLITIKRPTALSDMVKSFARKTQEDPEGESLVETVRRVRDLLQESWHQCLLNAAGLASQSI